MVFPPTVAAMELRDASKILCGEINTAARTGNILGREALLKKYNDNPTQYDSDTFGRFIANAFWRSCEHGHVKCTKKLHHLMANRKDRLRYGLEAACLRGRAHVVKFLLPILKREECLEASKILMASIQGGSIDVVKMVLPQVKSKVSRTNGLREACKYNNQAIFDLLYPLSNPQSALDIMEKSNAPDKETEMLRAEIARRQNIAISQAVGEGVNRVRKSKM